MKNVLHQASQFCKRNSSTILTTLGVIGIGLTAVSTVKATLKASDLLREAKEEKGEDLTAAEIVKAAAPVYIVPTLLGAATIACVIGANHLNKRKQASLIAAYGMLDSSFKNYRAKTLELYGEEADKHIREEIAKDDFKESPITPKDDTILFYDEYSARYFESTMEDVIKAEYQLNHDLTVDTYVCLNAFYDNLGIEPIDGGDELGWSSCQMMDMYWHQWIEFHHEKVVIDDDLECISISMHFEPTADYFEY